MPLYNYECHRHGAFSDWRNMSDSGKPAPCPACGDLSRRSVSAPYLGIDSGVRKAHRINERSADEPRVVRRRRGDPIPHDASRDLTAHCGSAHAHTHHHGGHSHSHGGGETQVSKHPWMIRH